jgi:hypothetical protein
MNNNGHLFHFNKYRNLFLIYDVIFIYHSTSVKAHALVYIDFSLHNILWVRFGEV